MNRNALIFFCVLFGMNGTVAANADEIFIRGEGDRPTRLEGTLLIEAQDQSVLFETRDGRLWIIKADRVDSKDDTDEIVSPMSGKEMESQLGAEFPGFQLHVTDHFIIAYNTERPFAQWLGGLYEQLYKGFTQYWERKRKFELVEPKFPLVIVAFRSFEEYSAHVRRELGQDPGSMVAYYNLMTNRVALYDLTAGFRSPNQVADSDRKIYEILANPNALAMVATVVHEGTHLLMFNLGMQTRLADTPLWVNEGLAMFFETPDMKNPRGWRTIGQVNPVRLANFQQAIQSRAGGGESLKNLIANDADFRDPQKLLSRYAEAWAFNYFLLNRYSKEYVTYLKILKDKRPVFVDTPETRLSDFQSAIKVDLPKLDAEFIEFMSKLRE